MSIEHLDWILLDKPPTWNEVNKSCHELIEKNLFAKNQRQKLFITFELLKSFVTREKVESWNGNKTDVDDRWVEFFRSLESKQDISSLSSIVEYALCIFGKYMIQIKDFISIISINSFICP